MQKPWIRLYTDLPMNRKVQNLSPDVFKFWVNLLCASSENGAVPSVRDLSFVTRIRPHRVRVYLGKLLEAHLIDADSSVDGAFNVHGWDERQFASDQSNERVRKHRDGRRNVTPSVTETPPEQSRAEQIQSRAEQPGVFDFKEHESKPPGIEERIDATAEALKARHPPVRACGLAEIRKNLKAIVGKLPQAGKVLALQRIETNHRGWCETEDWKRDGGQYAKGLANWLSPSMQRFLDPPPAKAGPPVDNRPRAADLDPSRILPLKTFEKIEKKAVGA